MHTLNCYALGHNGKVEIVGGTPGGDQQPQWNMQVITNLVDYGMDVQEAVEAPRWNGFPGSDPINLPNPFDVRIEARVHPDAIAGLRRRPRCARRRAIRRRRCGVPDPARSR